MPVFDLLHVYFEYAVFEFLGLVDELFEQLNDGVYYVFIVILKEFEQDLDMLVDESIVVLLTRIFDYLYDLEDQCL